MIEVLEPGWYWVKHSPNHQWSVCEYEEGLGWWIEEFSCNKPYNWFPIVGYRIPNPDEPFEIVPLKPKYKLEELIDQCDTHADMSDDEREWL